MNKEETKFKTTEKNPIPERVQIKINEYLTSKGREVKPDEQIKNKN
jgi:hypothetical protein